MLRECSGNSFKIEPPVGARNADGLVRTVEQLTSDQETRWTIAAASEAGSGATNGEQHGGALGSEDSPGDGGGTATYEKEAANAQPMEIDAPVGTPLTPHQIVSRSRVDICTLRV